MILTPALFPASQGMPAQRLLPTCLQQHGDDLNTDAWWTLMPMMMTELWASVPEPRLPDEVPTAAQHLPALWPYPGWLA